MTDIELLPLPESDCQPNALRWLFPVDQRERVQDYARANITHATAPLQAEIEALRSDLADYMRIANAEATRAERLAKALQKLAAHARPTCSLLWDEAQAALRDHDQEEGK